MKLSKRNKKRIKDFIYWVMMESPMKYLTFAVLIAFVYFSSIFLGYGPKGEFTSWRKWLRDRKFRKMGNPYRFETDLPHIENGNLRLPTEVDDGETVMILHPRHTQYLQRDGV